MIISGGNYVPRALGPTAGGARPPSRPATPPLSVGTFGVTRGRAPPAGRRRRRAGSGPGRGRDAGALARRPVPRSAPGAGAAGPGRSARLGAGPLSGRARLAAARAQGTAGAHDAEPGGRRRGGLDPDPGRPLGLRLQGPCAQPPAPAVALPRRCRRCRRPQGPLVRSAGGRAGRSWRCWRRLRCRCWSSSASGTSSRAPSAGERHW